ncbi:DNA topoisomerase I [Candidatus Phytoplasma mali]|uniref:DNA topoisomerase 1 n=1 Tax=Phytoplasma mali (strain AT) TaxID=482235 RepID=B3R098_PHYMT|nr:type I DNA topoisomerase [Candidatus Phytoplasma mali]CAP18262.1 DNA topoisomerase I [Candidatus Phytoplasma mali]
MKKLIIVESPAKAKTIYNYLNKEFLVLSSKGHVTNLSFTGKDGLGVDIENDFKPNYKVIADKKKIVQELIQSSKGKEVFLATDPDREGESIAWHLAKILNLDPTSKNRIIFREMTKNFIVDSVKNPQKINTMLVSSQETRRILDRIIGFKLSKLVKRFHSKSAGRVQSVALKLIVDLEINRNNFIPEEYYLIKVIFENFKVDLFINDSKKIKKEEVDEILKKIKGKSFMVKHIDKKTVYKNPSIAFITSTLQQTAFNELNMTSALTMMIAQRLYEGEIKIEGERTGLITYMRTDSTRMSLSFIENTQKFIKSNYGENYLGSYQQKKNVNSQDAHEAIRPTNINKTPESLKKYLKKDEYRIYSLIYYRTLSSLMKYAIFENTKVFFQSVDYTFILEGLVRKFDGYQKVLNIDNKDKILSNFSLKEVYYPKEFINEQCFTTPPTRFSEATLIKTLEKLNIGRPSTYSKIIKTLKDRFYVILENKRFVPNKQGILTKNILEKFFSDIINVKYTSQIEKQLDQIAIGKITQKNMLENFYCDFKNLYDIADKKITKIVPKITDQKCSLCNKFLSIKKGRYGEFLGCSGFPKCKNIVNLKKYYQK